MKAGLVGLGVAAAVVATKELYEIGKVFDDVSDTIQTTTGASGKALDGLVKSAQNVGKRVPQSWEAIGAAVGKVHARTNLTGKALEDLSTQMLNLSRISGVDLNTVIEQTSRMLGDAGLKGRDAARGLDELYRASTVTGVGIDRLAQLATKFGGPMRQLGFSFEETLALLGKFEKEGVNTELVMGSMRIALGRMAKAGKDPVTTLRAMMEQIRDTGSAGKANALALELFGARAGPDMAAAIREGRFSIDQLLGTIKNGKTTIDDTAKSTNDFSENWAMFKHNLDVLVAPAANAVFAGINEGMSAMIAHADDIAKVGKAFMPFIGVLHQVEGAVATVRAVMSGDWGAALNGLKQLGQGWLETLGPIRLLVPTVKSAITGAISAVTSAVGTAYSAALGFGNAIANALRTALSVVAAIARTAFTTAVNAVRAMAGAAASAATAVGTAIVSALRSALATIGSVASAAGQRVVSAVRTVVGAATSAGSAVGSAVVNGLRAGLATIASVASAAASRVSGAVRAAIGAASSAGSAIGQAIVNGVRGALSGLGGMVAGMVRDAISGIGGMVKGAIGGAVSHIPGVRSAAPPQYAPGPAPAPATGVRGLASGGGTMGGSLAGPTTLAQLVARQLAGTAEPAAPDLSGLEVRVYIGDTELRGLVRTEVVQSNTGIARVLLAGGKA